MKKLLSLRKYPVHILSFIGLGVIIGGMNVAIVILIYYIAQVAFEGSVIELQFTAYQGTTVIESASVVWWQILYSVGVTTLNAGIVWWLWRTKKIQRLLKYILIYWLMGMTIASLSGILYYLILVIRVNS